MAMKPEAKPGTRRSRGFLPDRLPSEFATSLGFMVGKPTVGDDRGDRPVGTATLNSDMTVGGLDADFGGSGNIDRGTADTVETAPFPDFEVGPPGKQGLPRAGGTQPVLPRPLS